MTAVQCFPYFDAERAADEIRRVLRPGGLFCKIMMDWMPQKDAVIAEMIRLVQAYNPLWSADGFSTYQYTVPAWAQGRFAAVEQVCYEEDLIFSREAWLGRVKTCRGVGAGLPPEKAAAFERHYREVLSRYDEPLRLRHQIQIELYRSTKGE